MTQNKLALVTGASRGIGKAVALKLASEGLDLIISARNKENLAKAKEEIKAISKGKVWSFLADLSKPSDCQNLVKDVLALNVPIDVLVNNAGVFAQGLILEEKGLENLMQINLFSVHTITQGLFSAIKKSPQAHIFNMCSIASIEAYPNSGAYTTTKFALLGYTKSLRVELAPQNIRVTAILPGATLTDSWNGVDIPENRFVKSEDIADTLWAAYQLSDTANLEEVVVRPTPGDI